MWIKLFSACKLLNGPIVFDVAVHIIKVASFFFLNTLEEKIIYIYIYIYIYTSFFPNFSPN